jgi:hypothetical protein
LDGEGLIRKLWFTFGKIIEKGEEEPIYAPLHERNFGGLAERTRLKPIKNSR